MASNDITTWPGSRGAFAGGRRGVIGLHDTSSPGRVHVVHNRWMALVQAGPTFPADRARGYYGGQWTGAASRDQQRAMQAQWMNIHLGQYNGGLPSVGGFR